MIKFENIATYNIYVGLNDKDTYEQIVSDDEAMDLIRNIVGEIVGGATFSKSFGHWVDEFGNPTNESTIVIKITDCTDDTIEAICMQINAALNQNCVMVEKTVSQIAFVSDRFNVGEEIFE